jgi:hypothetical protein
MSKFIYIVKRNDWNNKEAALFRSRLATAFASQQSDIKTFSKGHACLYVLRPAPNAQVSENLDYILSNPLHPDENPYVAIRNREHTIEASNDLLGTRVIWYYLDEDVLILSSSQIAIISYLRKFEPNPSAWSWMGCFQMALWALAFPGINAFKHCLPEPPSNLPFQTGR